MQIWVDADACPAAIKEPLYRASTRTKTKRTLVANRQAFANQLDRWLTAAKKGTP